MSDKHTPDNALLTKAKVYEFERASERPYYISCCAPTITKFVDLDDYKALEMNHDALMQQCDELLAIAQRLVDWCCKFPSSRIYSHSDIVKIAAEIDAIGGDAIKAIAKAGGK